MKIAGKIVGNIWYNRAESTRADFTQADLTRGRVDPHSHFPAKKKSFGALSNQFTYVTDKNNT